MNKKYIKYFFLVLISLSILFYFSFKDKLLEEWYFNYYKIVGNNNPSKNYIPSKYKVYGVDISRYQQKMDWDNLKIINQYSDTLPLSFVIAKATEGEGYKDPLYEYNYKKAKQNDSIIFGAYHYFHPSKNAIKQAQWFLKNAKLKSGNIVPIIDVEEEQGLSADEIKLKVHTYCNYIENRVGQKPIIYSGKYFLINILGETFKQYPTWVAHYNEKDIDMPNNWNWVLWQFTDKGSTFATTQEIDINAFNSKGFKIKEIRLK